MILHKNMLNTIKKVLLSSKLDLTIRFVIGSIFIYAGFIKLIDPKAFAKVISQYDIVPDSLLPVVAIGLPAVEFLAGLGLVLNIRGSLMVIFNLLVFFVMVLGYGIFNDMDIDCGCFSTDEISARNSLKQALFRDLFMILAACYLYVYKRIKYETNPGRS
ncbi:MAG: DoxX family membrane protein [Nitrospira sp.]|nr:DoxX family membrane protein [Nitrospira sp.]